MYARKWRCHYVLGGLDALHVRHIEERRGQKSKKVTKIIRIHQAMEDEGEVLGWESFFQSEDEKSLGESLLRELCNLVKF